MKLNIEKSVTVITPTIGQEYLTQAIESVNTQTYKNIKHLVVVDGPEYLNKVTALNISEYNTQLQVTVAPENTGGDGFYGHRIYAGYPHLINSDYIAFLDEDNWYERDHIKTLVATIEDKNLDWVYSLRNIHGKTGEFIIEDNCESLGKWPIHWSLSKKESDHEFLIDTSSYLFKTSFLTKVCNHWHSGWGGDRRFYHIISKVMGNTNYDTSGLHTMNYRLDDNMEKKYGSLDFFIKGNDLVKQHYNGEYPWQKTSSSAEHLITLGTN